MKRAHGQMSESLLLGALLAMAGGFFDAYTYLCRRCIYSLKHSLMHQDKL